jgi:hypothetical protein
MSNYLLPFYQDARLLHQLSSDVMGKYTRPGPYQTDCFSIEQLGYIVESFPKINVLPQSV